MSDQTILGPLGQRNGVEFNDSEVFNKSKSAIKKIVVRSGVVVDAITTTFADGTSTPRHGGTGGGEKVLELADNEYITLVTVHTSNVVNFIQLTTNFGNSLSAGFPVRDYQVSVTTADQAVLYFFGMNTVYMNQIGMVMGPPLNK